MARKRIQEKLSYILHPENISPGIKGEHEDNVKKKDLRCLRDGEKIGSYTAAEAEEELGIPQKHVSAYAKSNWKYQGRYNFSPQEGFQEGI